MVTVEQQHDLPRSFFTFEEAESYIRSVHPEATTKKEGDEGEFFVESADKKNPRLVAKIHEGDR